jgi:hypothetical protein
MIFQHNDTREEVFDLVPDGGSPLQLQTSKESFEGGIVSELRDLHKRQGWSPG